MKVFKLIALIFIVSSSFIACDKEEFESQSILGQWRWIKSVGGFAGWTYTPKSEGYTTDLIIDDFFYSEFRNGQLIYKSQYDLQIKSDTIFGSNKYINYENKNEQTIQFIEDTLTFYDYLFSHGYMSYYVRK